MIEHERSKSSIGSGVKAKVPLQQIAKAVMLINHEYKKLMAVLPATNKVSISAINDELLGSYKLLEEKEVYDMFSDCEHGAIPPVGEAFNLHMICDQLLDTLDHVYI